MQDHAILQRTLYKYEQTLADLDGAFRQSNGGEMVSDLKRIAEKQLKEIVMLQKEIDMVNQTPNQSQFKRQNFIELDNPIWSQTDDTYKSPCRPPKKLETASLLNERQQLLKLCEDLEKQIKESHRSLEDSLEKIFTLEKEIARKEKEVEDVRTRVTEIAELFERKEIKQRYSFEVLCDFIFDKAKRLFQKYELAVAKDKPPT